MKDWILILVGYVLANPSSAAVRLLLYKEPQEWGKVFGTTIALAIVYTACVGLWLGVTWLWYHYINPR